MKEKMKISLYITIYVWFTNYGKLSGYTYDVSVWTADQYNADTDDSVYLTIYGIKGALQEKELDAGFWRNDRERGRRDDMTLSFSKYAGKLYKVRLRIAGNDDWLVHKIQITDKSNWCQYVFYYNTWMGGAYADRKTSLYLRNPETTKLFKRRGKDSVMWGNSIGQNYTVHKCSNIFCSNICYSLHRCMAFNVFKTAGTSTNCICELKSVTIPVNTGSLVQSPTNAYYELVDFSNSVC